MKTNNKGKNNEAMHANFSSSTPWKRAQACTKKEKFVQGIVQAACYGIVSSAVDNCVKILVNKLRSLGCVIKSSEVYRSQKILMAVAVWKK